jgi:hypothetical protein
MRQHSRQKNMASTENPDLFLEFFRYVDTRLSRLEIFNLLKRFFIDLYIPSQTAL